MTSETTTRDESPLYPGPTRAGELSRGEWAEALDRFDQEDAAEEESEFNCPSCNKDVTEAELDRHENECCDECDRDPELRATCHGCDERFWLDDLDDGDCEECHEARRAELVDQIDEAISVIEAVKEESLGEMKKVLAQLKAAKLIS